MKKNVFKDKNYSMRSLLLVTYIAILVLALVSSLFCYGVLGGQLSEQLTERNDVILESIRAAIDGQLQTITDSTYNITVDADVRHIMNTMSQPLNPQQKYEIYRFVSNIKFMIGWGSVENVTDSLMIYFPHIDLIVKQDTSHDLKSFYNTYLYSNAMTAEDWEQFMNREHEGEYKVMAFGERRNEVFYIKTLYPLADKTKFINVIYKINQEKMLEMNRKLYLQKYGCFAVLDQDDRVILKSLPDVNEFGKEKNVSSLLYDTSNCVFQKKSGVNNWKYVYILPKHIAYKTLDDVRLIILGILCVYLLMGLGLIVYFTNMHYKPIQKMLSFFPDNNSQNEKKNEYSFLEQQISGILGKNEEIKQTASKQYSLLQTYLLNLVLTGQKLSEEKKHAEYECLNFDSENGNMVTFIMCARPEETVKNYQRTLSYRHFVISNILDELLTNLGFVFHSIEKNDTIVYVAEIRPSSGIEELYELIDFAYDVICAEFSFAFFSAFGGAHLGLSGIAESYQEAKDVMEYCLSGGKTGRMTYYEAKNLLSKRHFYSLSQENKLLNLLKTNEPEQLNREIHEIFRINLQPKAVSLNAVRYLVLDLFNTAKKFLIQNGRSVDKEFPEEVGFVDNIFQCSDVEQMEKTMRALFCSCAERMSFTQPTEDMVESIILYIKKNYADQNLSITMIADRFSVNHDYISRKFKETTGIRLNDYINNVRVERSKELLRDFDNLISNIAEEVGFSSYRTYVRVFANVTGITPKKYRDLQRK